MPFGQPLLILRNTGLVVLGLALGLVGYLVVSEQIDYRRGHMKGGPFPRSDLVGVWEASNGSRLTFLEDGRLLADRFADAPSALCGTKPCVLGWSLEESGPALPLVTDYWTDLDTTYEFDDALAPPSLHHGAIKLTHIRGAPVVFFFTESPFGGPRRDFRKVSGGRT